MFCKECGKKMFLDDVDERFKGNKDNYWCCNECNTSCVEEIRFNQSYREYWHSENNNKVKDYVIRKRINTKVRK